MKQELSSQILPPTHPLSILVRKVASRILQHSHLGRIRGESPATPPTHFISPHFGHDPNDQGDTSQAWHPSDDYGSAARDTYGPEKEWDVVVVNDEKVINAMATPGDFLPSLGLYLILRDLNLIFF